MARESQFPNLSGLDQALSFDCREFLKKNFSADAFLQEHSHKTSLETLRDDLGMYLRILRASVIELINKDYADFVNLASNLIDLDKAINGMQCPLGQLKEEIIRVKFVLEETFNSVSELLKQRKDVFKEKWCLQNLLNIEFFLTKFSKVLDLNEGSEIKCLDPVHIERVALEYSKTMFALSQCETWLSTDHDEEAEEICRIMMEGLNSSFLTYIGRKDITAVAHCLRIYVILERVSDAEQLYRQQVVSPGLDKIIDMSAIVSNPDFLLTTFDLITDFVDTEMKTILDLHKLARRYPVIKSFAFVLNSFWPELEQKLEINMPAMFSPGNPDVFQKNFKETELFIQKVMCYCEIEGTLEQFQEHPLYNSFLRKWNLSVYYQLRFQELAAPTENVLSDDILPWSKPKIDISFFLYATDITFNCVKRCWCETTFMKQLIPNFWKLTLLLLARYIFWIRNVVIERWPKVVENAVLKPESASEGAQDWKARRYLVPLYNDIDVLLSKVPRIHTYAIQRIGENFFKLERYFKENLDTTAIELQDVKPKLTEIIVNEVSRESLIRLKYVSDIPRLYRRTNREVPTKACPYVLQIFEIPKQFCDCNEIRPDSKITWAVQIYSNITKHYMIAVQEVLTSVQRTEESLRRLKKYKDKSASPNSNESNVIGDDEKIRIQIAIDVMTYCKEVEKMGITIHNIPYLEQFKAMVYDICCKYDLL